MAVAAFAVVGNFDVFGHEAFRQSRLEFGNQGFGQLDIDNFAAFFAVKVRVLSEIRALARRFTLKIDRAHQATVH